MTLTRPETTTEELAAEKALGAAAGRCIGAVRLVVGSGMTGPLGMTTLAAALRDYDAALARFAAAEAAKPPARVLGRRTD